ncbi:MAG: EamA family transporter [Actinomycetota bacterium]
MSPFDVPHDAVPDVIEAAAHRSPRATGVIVAVLLFFSVSFAVAGQLTLKSAMEKVGRIGTAQVTAPLETIGRVGKEPLLWAGLTLFGISAVFWLIVLSHVPLSVAYPVVGLSYVIIVAFSRLVLHEHVPTIRWLGVFVVGLGIAIIGWSFKRTTGA